MAKKSVKAETPQNTDVLKINDIINQKIDIPAGQQLTYLPITGAVASSSVANQGPLNVLDSSPDTYWQPSDQVAGAHVELQTPNPYECYGVDIKFKESEGKKFNLKVDVLDKEHNRWLTVVTAESSLIDDNKYERFQAAQKFKSDTYRIIINSVFDTQTNHLYTQPKITQIRLFGLVPDADVAKYKVKTDQECPEGYGKDAESGQCVKSIPSQIIKPKTVDAKSAVDMGDQTPAGNDPENLLSVNPNDKLTLKGVGSTIEYGLARTDAVYGVYIHKLNNPPRQYTLLVAFYNGEDKQPFYSFVVDIPDSQDKYVHLINQPLRADRFVLSVVDNTEPNQWFSLFGLYLIGEQNAGEPPKPTEEPPIPKSCSIKQGGWGSTSDNKPEEWTAKAMDKPQGKWKGIGKDGKNVFHLCDSKDDAEAFIARKIWESKQTPPPVEPPVEPPVTGNIVDGIAFPVAKEELTGKKRVDDYHYNPNDGLRIDFEKNPKDGSYVNSALAVYGTFLDNPTTGEDRCVKWSWANHTGSGTRVNTYIVNIRNGDGASRMRFEQDHPNGYHTLVDWGTKGTPAKKGQLWSLMGIRRTILDASGKPTGVKLEVWEDQGIVDNKPGNKWVKLREHIDTKYMITTYPNGMEVTGRFDHDGGDKNIKIQKAVLVELKPITASPASAPKPKPKK